MSFVTTVETHVTHINTTAEAIPTVEELHSVAAPASTVQALALHLEGFECVYGEIGKTANLSKDPLKRFSDQQGLTRCLQSATKEGQEVRVGPSATSGNLGILTVFNATDRGQSIGIWVPRSTEETAAA